MATERADSAHSSSESAPTWVLIDGFVYCRTSLEPKDSDVVLSPRPCTACGGTRDIEIANVCRRCIESGALFPATGDAQVKVSKALEAIQDLKAGSLTEREAELFFLYGRQIFDAIDRAKAA